MKEKLKYFREATGMDLFYSRDSKAELVRYVDTVYRSNPRKRTRMIILPYLGAYKIDLAPTFLNHVELLTFREASREPYSRFIWSFALQRKSYYLIRRHRSLKYSNLVDLFIK